VYVLGPIIVVGLDVSVTMLL